MRCENEEYDVWDMCDIEYTCNEWIPYTIDQFFSIELCNEIEEVNAL